MTRVLLAWGLVILLGTLVHLAGAQAEAPESTSPRHDQTSAMMAASPPASVSASGPEAAGPLPQASVGIPSAPASPLLALASRSGLLLLCLVLMTVALLVMHRRHPHQATTPEASDKKTGEPATHASDPAG